MPAARPREPARAAGCRGFEGGAQLPLASPMSDIG